ncbi:hypothetical protein [Weissella confusa]|uniref:hypothetical protein n=1 Tax=Weissella confusa TaxID=1583 RepID=UPI001F554AC7|nr:hypothetical protein [Weissella confusa]
MATILNHQNIEPDAGLVAKIIAHDSQTPIANELHWHQALEITFMLDWPESVIVIGQNRAIHKSGDIWLVNPMQIHNYKALYKVATPTALTILFPYNFLAAIYGDIARGSFELNLQRRDALWYEIVDFEAAVDDDAIAKHFATLTETQFQVLAKIQQEWQGA